MAQQPSGFTRVVEKPTHGNLPPLAPQPGVPTDTPLQTQAPQPPNIIAATWVSPMTGVNPDPDRNVDGVLVHPGKSYWIDGNQHVGRLKRPDQFQQLSAEQIAANYDRIIVNPILLNGGEVPDKNVFVQPQKKELAATSVDKKATNNKPAKKAASKD